MRNASLGELLKVWLYAGCAVLLGAWLAPLVHDAGKALADVSSAKQINAPIHSLAAHCRAANFHDFYRSSLLLAALILLPPFSDWLARGRGAGFGKLIALTRPGTSHSHHALAHNPLGIKQALHGFSRVTGLLLAITAALTLGGLLEWKNPSVPLSSLVLGTLAAAIIHASLQEILFRGIAMSVFLQALPARMAALMSACLFTLTHLALHAAKAPLAAPDASDAGWQMLMQTFSQLIHFQYAITTLVPLLALGSVLACARLRTASLWLSVGLHAAWSFASQLSAGMTSPAADPPAITGFIPLASILAIHFVARHLPPQLHAAPTES